MTFGAAGYLFALLLVPAAMAALLAHGRWRRRAAARFGSGVRAGGWPVISALVLGAVALAAFAAARPQFGERSVVVQERGIDVVIVLDVSQSMYAADARPTRVGRAEAEIVALLERMSGDRVGLVVFAGTPFVRSPLTTDLPALARLAAGVDAERGLVDPGSDLGEAIRRAAEVLSRAESETRAMLVISDGEDHGGGVLPAVSAARTAGVRVFAAGVGTEEGSPVLDLDPATFELRPRVDAGGQPVVTRLDAAQLERIAEAGAGRYLEIAGDGRPLASLASELEALGETVFGEREDSAPIERFQIFAAIAAALAAATLLPAALSPEASRRAARLWPLGAAGLLIGAMCMSDVAELNERGNERYAAGDFEGAVEAYRTAQALAPERRELNYNAGNALERAGDYASAIDETRRALEGADAALAALAEYALGNHYAAADRLGDALEAYKRALLADPSDQDAKHNLEVVSRRLQPTPTSTPPAAPPEAVPTPGDVDGGEPQPGEGTPGAGDGTPGTGAGTGTPGAGGTPQPGREMTPEELQRALVEALRGIDEEFETEEALRVLELLEQYNRTQLAEAPAGGRGVPDY